MTYIIIQVVACVIIYVYTMYIQFTNLVNKFTIIVNFLFHYIINMIVLTAMLLVCGYVNVTEKDCKLFDKLMFVVYILLFIWSALWF